MGTCVHFSRALPSNSWWQTMVGWHVLSRPSAAEGGGRRPAFTGLATSHTRPPRSTAGNINSAGCLKTGPQYKHAPERCALARHTEPLRVKSVPTKLRGPAAPPEGISRLVHRQWQTRG